MHSALFATAQARLQNPCRSEALAMPSPQYGTKPCPADLPLISGGAGWTVLRYRTFLNPTLQGKRFAVRKDKRQPAKAGAGLAKKPRKRRPSKATNLEIEPSTGTGSTME